MTQDVLFLIPARGGSKRLPGKNVRELAGRSLLARLDDTLRSTGAHAAPRLLSTDDTVIQAEGLKLGWMSPWLRPAELATDGASSLDVAIHALDWWRSTYAVDPEVLVLLQPTSPFRAASDIDAAMAMFASRRNVDAVVGVQRLHRSPKTLFAQNDQGRMIALSEEDGPGTIMTPNGSLYAIRSSCLRARKSFFPERSVGLEMDVIHSIDIDTPQDWFLAEAVAARMEAAS